MDTADGQMSHFRGLGSVAQGRPNEKLFSRERLLQAWENRRKWRAAAYGWMLLILGLHGLLYLVGPQAGFVTVPGALYATHRLLALPYRRTVAEASPNRVSLAIGYASLVAYLAAVCALLLKYDRTALFLVAPCLLSFYGLMWIFQFFPAVANVEGRGFGRDLIRSWQLLRGHQVELLMAYFLLAVALQVGQLLGYLAGAVGLGLPALLLHQILPQAGWLQGALLAAFVVLQLAFGGEIMILAMTYHAGVYEELRARRESAP